MESHWLDWHSRQLQLGSNMSSSQDKVHIDNIIAGDCESSPTFQPLAVTSSFDDIVDNIHRHLIILKHHSNRKNNNNDGDDLLPFLPVHFMAGHQQMVASMFSPPPGSAVARVRQDEQRFWKVHGHVDSDVLEMQRQLSQHRLASLNSHISSAPSNSSSNNNHHHGKSCELHWLYST